MEQTLAGGSHGVVRLRQEKGASEAIAWSHAWRARGGLAWVSSGAEGKGPRLKPESWNAGFQRPEGRCSLRPTAPLRGAGGFWAGFPRVALRFTRGYFHPVPPGPRAVGQAIAWSVAWERRSREDRMGILLDRGE